MSEQSAATTVTVVKVGGAQLERPEQMAALARYLGGLPRGSTAVVVHGGGPDIGRMHEALGKSYDKRMGLRVTPDDAMPVVTMVLCGLVNKRLVVELVAAGLPAIGLGGVDLGLLSAGFLNRDLLGRVGGPPSVNTDALRRLLDQGYVPVIAPVCLGPDGMPVNVNADTVAHAVATALQARSLEFVSDIPGVLDGAKQVLRRLDRHDVKQLMDSAAVSGGMIPKLQAAVAAVDAGVARVRVGDLEHMIDNTATEIVA